MVALDIRTRPATTLTQKVSATKRLLIIGLELSHDQITRHRLPFQDEDLREAQTRSESLRLSCCNNYLYSYPRAS